MSRANVNPDEIRSKNEKPVLYASLVALAIVFLVVLDITLGLVILMVGLLAL